VKSAWLNTRPAGVAVGEAVAVGLGAEVGLGVGPRVGVVVGLGGEAQAAIRNIVMSSPRLAMAAETRAQALGLHQLSGNRLRPMTEQSHGLDYGLIGALTDIGAAIVLAVLLAIATDWTGDAAPRPIIVAALYGTPGVIALLGVIAKRPWLLLAGGLPLLPAAGLAASGATFVFLVPAVLMILGASRMLAQPDAARLTVANGVAAGVITTLILVAGYAVLIGLTVYACHPIVGGQACGDGYISNNGLIVAVVCLALAVGIAVVGVALPLWRSRQNPL